MSDTKPSSKATQQFVPIKEVREGVLILKDNSMRAIVLTSSINFALKSATEQQAIISQFQNFLNSLNFPIQIFVESRKLDIRPYIALLEKQEREQTGDLMKIQTREYIEFIKSFTESSNIMTKSFFVVVPYTPGVISTTTSNNPLSMLQKKKSAEATAVDASQNFEENLSQLEQRVEVVEQGLVRCGIRVAKLGTEELIELFYKIFNPGDIDKPIHVS